MKKSLSHSIREFLSNAGVGSLALVGLASLSPLAGSESRSYGIDHE